MSTDRKAMFVREVIEERRLNAIKIKARLCKTGKRRESSFALEAKTPPALNKVYEFSFQQALVTIFLTPRGSKEDDRVYIIAIPYECMYKVSCRTSITRCRGYTYIL